MSSNIEEIGNIMINMRNSTAVILQRQNSIQTKRLKETWVETGIKIDAWNSNVTHLMRNFYNYSLDDLKKLLVQERID